MYLEEESRDWDLNRQSYFAMEADEQPVPASFYRREWWEDTQFDPKKNYPRGVLQTVEVDLGEEGVWDMTFFPECKDVCRAITGRPSGALWDDEQFKLMTSHHNSHINSWNFDGISNGEAISKEEKYENMWMKRDLEIIREMLEEQLSLESSEDAEIFKLMDQWIDWCGFEDDVSVRNMFSALEEEVEGHVIRARAGPPKGKYLTRHLPNHSSFEQGVMFDPTDIQWPSSVEEANSRFIPEYVTKWMSYSDINPDYDRTGRGVHPWFSWTVDDLKSFLPRRIEGSKFLELPWKKTARGRWSTLQYYPTPHAMDDEMNNEGEFITKGYCSILGRPRWDQDVVAHTKYGVCTIPQSLVRDVLDNRIALGKPVFLLCRFAEVWCHGKPLIAGAVCKSDYGVPIFPGK
jgi:hypothetical protein